ncbi:MAG: hypothetical protein R3B13_39480 [Polyangiaceae bacterium]
MSVWAVPAVIVALVALIGLLAWWVNPKRWLTKITPTPVVYAKDGMRIKVTGELICDGEPLTAPVSGRRAAAWVLEVTQRGHNDHGQRGAGERTIAKESRATQFVIDDGSGRALIRAPVERMNLVLTRQGEADSWIAKEPAATLIRRLSAEHGINPAFRDNTGFIRFKEAAAEVGSRISVAGWCRWIQDERGERTLLLEPRASDGLELIVCDDPAVVAVNPTRPAPGYRLST